MEWAVLAIGVVILVATYSKSSTSQIETRTCALDRVMGDTFASCEAFNGTGWYIVGGALTIIGILAIVMRDALEGLFVRASRPGVRPTSVATELQKAEALLNSGAINAEEFAALKKRLLGP